MTTSGGMTDPEVAQAVDETIARAEDAHDDQAHPGDGTYVTVALVLAALTALEVSTYFVDFGVLMVPVLMVLMVLKFAIVALWFMHLRFDSLLFRRLFVAGIVLAVGVYLAALSSFQYFSE